MTIRNALAPVLGLLFALTAPPASATLQDGQVINLKALGSGGTAVWLQGDPNTGAVQLATDAAASSGTAWQVVVAPGGTTIGLKNLASGAKPWLGGDTGQATVQLTDDTSGNAGTFWQVQDNGDGTISLACVGGPGVYPWLDGETAQGSVMLRENNITYPGTRWQVQNSSSTPGCFKLTSPANGSTVTIPATLTWEASAGATAYGLDIYDTSCGNGTAIYSIPNLTATTYAVPAGVLQGGKTYAWLVSGVNASGTTFSNNCTTSPANACWTFTAVTPAPGCFDLSSPASGASVTTTPTLKWKSSANATGYDVRIYDTFCGNGDAVHAASGLTSTSYTVPEGALASGRVYSWLVRAVNDTGFTHSNSCSTSYSGACWTFGVQTSTMNEFPVPTAGSRPGFVTSGPDGNLWFTEYQGNKVGRMTPAGLVTEFPIPTANSWPSGIVSGPDGNLWFTEAGGNNIGRITPSGAVTEFPIPTAASLSYAIAAGADGNLWFAEFSGNRIGKITPAGVVTEFPVPTARSWPYGIAAGPDGNVWFTEANANAVGMITPDGAITEFPLPNANSRPRGVTAGPDGNVWFTEYGGNRIGTITPSGVVTEFALPSASSWPFGIVLGSDRNLWFTEYGGNRIGTVTASGVVTEFTVPTAGSSPAGIASGPDGNVWFTEQDGNKIGEFVLAPAVRSLTVPIVLSNAGLNGSLFTSELSLTNRGTSDAPLTFTYVPAFGETGAGGSGTDTLPAGTQRIVPDAIEYLRSLGIATGAAGSSGGTLRIDAAGFAAATVRTTTAVSGGRAGLAYRGLSRGQLLSDPAWIPGLRQNAADRSNVAVLNAGSGSEGTITLRLTVVSGDPAHPQTLALPDVTLAPGAFSQVPGVLASSGLSLTNGYVKVERVSGTAPFYAYGVVNDQANSDGSFVEPVPAGAASPVSRLTLPVLVETSAYSSELVVTNFTSSPRTLHATWAASSLAAGQVTFDLPLLPNEQQILPAFVQVLRDRGVVKDAAGPGFAGALFVTDASGDLRGVSVAARTSTPGGGGRYGVFYSAVPAGSEASSSAWLYDLRQDAENRTNLALVNLGSTDSSADTFRIDLYDGASGRKAAAVDGVSVPAKGFLQIDEILKRNAPSVVSGYALVTRTSGNNPFLAYAVINDGGQPGARSGDGAFVTADIPAGP